MTVALGIRTVLRWMHRSVWHVTTPDFFAICFAFARRCTHILQYYSSFLCTCAIQTFQTVHMRRSGPMRFAPSARTQAADSLPPTASSGTLRLLFPPHQKIFGEHEFIRAWAATTCNMHFESSDITESKIQSQPCSADSLCYLFGRICFIRCFIRTIFIISLHIFFITFWYSRFIFSQHLRVSCFSDEHKMLRDMCRTFADTELAPNAGKWLDTNIYLHACVCVL
jgi:hypothetical protein